MDRADVAALANSVREAFVGSGEEGRDGAREKQKGRFRGPSVTFEASA